MNRAGRTLGRELLADYRELGKLPPEPAILILLGKGHNGGDALLAADEICQHHPEAEVFVLPMQPMEECRSLTRRALDGLQRHPKVQVVPLARVQNHHFAICLDGLLGMNFRPPLREAARQILRMVNRHTGIRLRAAVDLPSGLGDEDAYQADFTYATGIAKAPLFDSALAEKVGRIRYLDIGFFDGGYDGAHAFGESVLHPQVLAPLRKLRPAVCDKRTFGHLFVLSGSRSMPGALLMSVRAALHSGVGLLTAFAPESVAAQFAAVLPEVMWIPWPETPEGGLALEGRHLLRQHIGRADALLAGSGLGREPETLELIRSLVEEVSAPIVLDADALMPEILDAAKGRHPEFGSLVATPHAGEFKRMAGRETTDYESRALLQYCRELQLTTVLKGHMTRVCNGERIVNATFGGPVLARGGSGDMLAGLAGGMLAQTPHEPFGAACCAVAWHGLAAQRLAREKGAQAVITTDLIGQLGPVLREGV